MNQEQKDELALRLDEYAATLDKNEFLIPTVNGKKFWQTYPAMSSDPNIPLPEPNPWFVICIIRFFSTPTGIKYSWSHALSVEAHETSMEITLQRVANEISYMRQLPELPADIATQMQVPERNTGFIGKTPICKANEKIVTDWFMQHDDAVTRLARVAA